MPSCDHKQRKFGRKQRFNPFLAGFLVNRGQIGKFHIAANLDSLRIEVLVKARNLQPRAVYIVVRNQNLLHRLGCIQHLQLEFADDFRQ